MPLPAFAHTNEPTSNPLGADGDAVKGKSLASSSDTPIAPTAEALAQALRVRIQRSELAPGEWLREVRLCSEFGVGRSIVRRALRALADDGLIEIEENRGARVSATTVEEVFDLYEVRAALYGLAARFACLRAPDAAIKRILTRIDRLLALAEEKAPAEAIMEVSEAIFGEMSSYGSADAQRMTEAVRRKTRFHFSYVALAINANGPGPYEHWRTVRAGLVERDADKASQAARNILYFMQGEVARIMLARSPRPRTDMASPEAATPRRRAAGKAK
ncbi:GntR family transcriptional regulator [Caulobacter sp. SLTY]|uniref:GntR family transcriptional regulator n=1 Tax=Caulobacter sp. SLTY TaxID=2683262 RepID=UPI001412798D|nr:GntR family transcriptional regulator [Caulobacter sp. SLTY]NBB15146.1 GntR family transcriptional regulator [Caulobacter sp. SLTY]